MMRRRVASALFAAVLALAVTAPIAASDRDLAAREAFGAGDAAFERHDYRAAALAYETAFQLSPNGVAAYNAALAWKRTSEREREADALALAVSTPGLPERRKAEASARLKEVSRSLGVLAIEAPPGSRVTVRHAERREPPLEVHVIPGEHEVIAERPDGGREVQRVAAKAGETVPVKFAAPEVHAGTAPLKDTKPPAPPSDPGALQRTFGWIGLGVGAAAGIAAGGTGIATLQAYSRAKETNAEEDKTTFRGLRDTTNGLAVGAGAVGITGLVLLLTAPRRPAKAAPSPKAGVGPCGSPGGAAICGRF